MITDIIRITITIRTSTVAITRIIPIIIEAKGVVVLGTTLEVEVVLVVSGVIKGVIEVEVVLVRVVLGCGVVVSSDGVTLKEEKEEMNDEESVEEEDKNVVNDGLVVLSIDVNRVTMEEEAMNDGESVGEEDKNGVLVVLSIDVNRVTMEEEAMNDGESVEEDVVIDINGVINDAVVVLTTDVGIVMLALVVTSTVKEIILDISSMDGVLSTMDDKLVLG